jgi:probable F420-dependent oxidoreductase
MKFAIRIPGNFLYPSITSSWEAQVTGADTIHFARAVDDLGFDWLWVSEHIVQDPRLVPSMGSRFYEGLTAMSALLGATTRIRALTYVAVLPYHHPLVYAKAIATADVLSGGRVIMGLGVGYMRREFKALGVPYQRRGRRTDEYLRSMKELWTSDQPAFHGEFVDFENILFEPKPVQQPHPPILVGGDSRPVLRRAAMLGDGWLPWLTPRRELPSCLAHIHEERAKHGRSGPFEVPMLLVDMDEANRFDMSRFRIPRTRDEVMPLVERLHEDQATAAVVHLPVGTSGLTECLEWTEWFAKEIIPQFGHTARS